MNTGVLWKVLLRVIGGAALGIIAAWGLYWGWALLPTVSHGADAGLTPEMSGEAWLLAVLAVSNGVLAILLATLRWRFGAISESVMAVESAVRGLPMTLPQCKAKPVEQASLGSGLEELVRGMRRVTEDVGQVRRIVDARDVLRAENPRPLPEPLIAYERSFDELLQDYCAGGLTHAILVASATKKGHAWGGASAFSDSTDLIQVHPNSDDRRVLYFERAPGAQQFYLVLKDGAFLDMNVSMWFKPGSAVNTGTLDGAPRIFTHKPALAQRSGEHLKISELGLFRMDES